MSDTSCGKRGRGEATELIGAVRRNACLWDRASAGYRDRALRDQAWRAVCQALHPEYPDLSAAERHQLGLTVMRRWYNIRDHFKKTYSPKDKSSQGSRPYLYSDLLTFLIPIFEGRTKPEDPIKDETVEVPEDDEHEQVEWLNVFELDQSEAPPAKKSKPLPKEKTEDDSVMSVLVNLIDKEEDEDRAFFRSITPTVKSLPDDVKFKFRIRVMELLNKMKKHNSTKRIASEESDTE